MSATKEREEDIFAYLPNKREISSPKEEEEVKVSKTDLDPLFDPRNERKSFLPIKFHDVYDLYQKHQASFWTVAEIDLSNDKKDFDKLDEKKKKFLEMFLAFFACFDTLVNEN